ncbi:inositol 1,4,5-trisphosphate receptor-interacting protein-like 1 [Strigops habroptila]|nr:inositol 1,4,5-trisphosphate receptor-interacting protein-like 1 [Strigops habroptila]
MAVTNFLACVLQHLIMSMHVFADKRDEPMYDCMQQSLAQVSQWMARLLQELESQQKSLVPWRALLSAALQHWQLGLIAGVLLLLSVRLSRWLRKRSHEEDEDADSQRDFRMYFSKGIKHSGSKLRYQSELVLWLVDKLLHACQEQLPKRFFPVLEQAIGVDSAFEGWSPHEDDAVYCLLVPLKPPRGHAFHLEVGVMGLGLVMDSCIRVEQVCTCTTEQVAQDMPCFLHHPEKALRKNQKSSLLHTLCTSSYLDVEKTALWFQDLMRSAWEFVPQSRHYSMKVLPSSRSCKLQFTDVSGRTLLVEMMLGMQHGDSDIFVSSQATEALFTPSTTWSVSYAVAESKFFWVMARLLPTDSCHLSCLQLCTRFLVGTGLSSHILKTVVMHLLNTMPLAGWRRSRFPEQLDEIMWDLELCLEKRCLNHFFIGNEDLYEEIIMPQALQRAVPLNLLEHLKHDPAAHKQAMRELKELKNLLSIQLFYRH